MDLQAAKDLNAGMWLFARIGVVVCFGLAGALLAASLWHAAKARAAFEADAGVHMSVSSPSLPRG